MRYLEWMTIGLLRGERRKAKRYAFENQLADDTPAIWLKQQYSHARDESRDESKYFVQPNGWHRAGDFIDLFDDHEYKGCTRSKEIILQGQ
jgi:hypothetical protein